MTNPVVLKTLLVLLVNLGAFALVAFGKLDWASAKEVLVWTVGPLLAGHSIESAASSIAASHLASTKVRFQAIHDVVHGVDQAAKEVMGEEPNTTKEGKTLSTSEKKPS
jgi:hypothetical protein